MRKSVEYRGFWKMTYECHSFEATKRLVRRLEKVNRHPHWDPKFWNHGIWIKI